MEDDYLGIENSIWKGFNVGGCLECLGNSKEVRVWLERRGGGDEVRERVKV